MSETTQSPPTRRPNHSPMRRLRIALLSSDVDENSYKETIGHKEVSGGVVDDNEVVVQRAAIPEVLTLLQQSDPDNELYAELVISPLPPEKRGYKKVDQGASALEALKAKLGG